MVLHLKHEIYELLCSDHSLLLPNEYGNPAGFIRSKSQDATIYQKEAQLNEESRPESESVLRRLH